MRVCFQPPAKTTIHMDGNPNSAGMLDLDPKAERRDTQGAYGT